LNSKVNKGTSVGRETSPTGSDEHFELYRDPSTYTIGAPSLNMPTSIKNFERNYSTNELKKGDDKKLAKMRKIMGQAPRSGKSMSVLKNDYRNSLEKSLDQSIPKIGYNLKMN
jgi:hypothetical protein